jgi:nucleotide-binding universal stress UspA family protein
MAEAIERLARAGVAFRALTAVGSPAACIAAVAEAEQVDEILMGVGRHPQWLRWLNPSIAQGVVARTDIPVAVMARGKESALERYLVPAGVAGLAALLITAD